MNNALSSEFSWFLNNWSHKSFFILSFKSYFNINIKEFILRKILLVDDEPTVLKLTTMILERQNFQITSFDSPLKALKAIDPHDFDLIISDLVMPKMNGLEFLKEMRNQDPDSKAIIISASADIARLQEIDETDTRYLSKPFKFDELVDLINSVLK